MLARTLVEAAASLSQGPDPAGGQCVVALHSFLAPAKAGMGHPLRNASFAETTSGPAGFAEVT